MGQLNLQRLHHPTRSLPCTRELATVVEPESLDFPHYVPKRGHIVRVHMLFLHLKLSRDHQGMVIRNIEFVSNQRKN